MYVQPVAALRHLETAAGRRTLGSPVAGYAQVRIHLADSTANPAVDFLRTHYYPQNQPPTVKTPVMAFSMAPFKDPSAV